MEDCTELIILITLCKKTIKGNMEGGYKVGVPILFNDSADRCC